MSGFRYAICNETFRDVSVERTIELARHYGYAGVEIAPFTIAADCRAIDPQRRAELRATIERCGLETVGLHWLLAGTTGFHLTSDDPATRARTADYLVDLGRLCRDLGGSLMVLGSPQQRNLPSGVTHDEGTERAAQVLRTACGELESLGVTLAVEPLGPAEGNFLLTAEQGIELIERVASPACRLHLDVKAMSSESKAIPEIIRDSAEHLVHFHANDANRRGPGMGEIGFEPILAALRQIDYRGWVSVEVFDYEPGPDALAGGSLDYLRSCEPR